MERRIAALTVVLASALSGMGNAAEGPSFDCAKAVTGAEQAVCASPELATLDRLLAAIYARATRAPGVPATLAAEQRGWIKGRDDCWKTADPGVCVTRAYVSRIGELVTAVPAALGDAPVVGPVATTCDGIAGPMAAVFVNTDPGFVTLAWGDMRVVLDQAISGSGARFTAEIDGGTYEFWEKGAEATFTAPALANAAQCVLRQ